MIRLPRIIRLRSFIGGCAARSFPGGSDLSVPRTLEQGRKHVTGISPIRTEDLFHYESDVIGDALDATTGSISYEIAVAREVEEMAIARRE